MSGLPVRFGVSLALTLALAATAWAGVPRVVLIEDFTATW